MNNDIAKIHTLTDLGAFDEIIDVRSPAEFAEDHIPGAHNCPVLDDQQRVEVGTLYKRISPFAARKVGAAYVAENIARHLRETFNQRVKTWRPLIICWRGGQRSASLTHVLRRIGWDAHQLDGGYRTYRRLVVEELAVLPRRLRMRVLCGATGSGKSRILQSIGRLGAQILDLEDLACHKGSVLGVLPETPQPSQKMFETRLLRAIRSFDLEQPVYVEAESRKIGFIHLPAALIETMRAGDCLHVDASLTARVDFLLRDYAYFLAAPDCLDACLQSLRRLHSAETLARWRMLAVEGHWRELVGTLLTAHYDPLYARSQSHNYAGYAAPQHFPTDDLTPAGIETLAQRICRSPIVTAVRPAAEMTAPA